MVLFITLFPIVLLITILLAGMVDMMLLDGAIADFLEARARHWLNSKMPKEN